ncbi:MAG: prolyl oligopeptidase family serine peptidase [Gemmatimonadales bacterium]|nr:prolyl oligopeptidase family serine peptidase [Gemmatimonadales bacterium]NIN13360.1 prolyl oligopeptidase family serine peptidase [Gemmatimonadales bacterium]NIN51363.1 prolyl oligopeptidase family serine peptidase [Gemmatimonadales bacterium]NIP08827.1 prolyl oligopeptidase family serine peptidase [Gemmatimonadales bacterium]NIQ99821.1 prolyl oligopeptidase family serine peptidase [Gemmatimonadales bacterium]
MKMLSFAVLAPAVVLLPSRASAQAAGRPLQVDEFLTLDRVSDPQISPDGRWVLYTVTTTDLDANSRSSDIWLQSVDGGEPRRISDDRRGGAQARWSPDGETVAYVTTRGGTPQVRLYTAARRRTRPLTSLSTGASGVIWSPTGTHLAFVSRVYPDCPDDQCNARRLEEVAQRASEARVYEHLLYRHWTVWEDGRRSHLFVVPASGGDPVDVTAGKDYDVPVPPFGGSSDYAFLADGQALVFATKQGTDEAWHTNSDIYQVALDGGEPRNLTAGYLGAEQHPAPSPDGSTLAFLSQERPGFESDRWRLMVLDLATGRVRELTQDFDRWVADYQWLRNSREIVFTAEDRHRNVIYRTDLSGRVRELLRWGNSSQLSVGGDSTILAFVNDAVHRPPQVYLWTIGASGSPRRLTDLNAAVLGEVVMHPAQEISWVGADGNTVLGMLVRPPQFRRGLRYPLLVLIHGGPQGAWRDNFHSRWNAQLFAAGGYVTVLLNPRGSTGFGQRFVDQISQDWGGRVYIDIMSGVEHAARFRFVDSTRIAAAGGSYGGYMINWINGHSDRFDALITHAGIYNLESFYGATEELWFPEWEFAGPPWRNRTFYEQWSPHRFAQNFRTPTLVIHGALDFRVPDTQGLEAFTALRRQGIPARLLYFPDEGHWIGKPRNQQVWWTEVHTWLARYLSPGATP